MINWHGSLKIAALPDTMLLRLTFCHYFQYYAVNGLFGFGMMVDNVDWKTDRDVLCQGGNKISVAFNITSNCQYIKAGKKYWSYENSE